MTGSTGTDGDGSHPLTINNWHLVGVFDGECARNPVGTEEKEQIDLYCGHRRGAQ